MKFLRYIFHVELTYLCNTVQQLGHGLSSFQLRLFHCLQFDQNCIDLGHDAADGMFHAIYTAA